MVDDSRQPRFPARDFRPFAPGVFMAAVEDDIVMLDCRSDSYGCLPEAAPHVIIADHSVSADPDMLAALQDANLLSDECQPLRRSLPPTPTVEMNTTGKGLAVRDAVRFLASCRDARRLGQSPSIERFLEALPPEPRGVPDPGRVASITATFQNLLPWAPAQGVCLWRAFVLLAMLRRAGQTATWMFGVRTWPFSAHCWLQVGDTVLDDDPERVAAYTPIMAV